MFSESVELPVRGTPTRYPFDAYEIWLGTASPPQPAPRATDPSSGAPTGGPLVATLQNQQSRFVMAPPVAIDPRRVAAASGPFELREVYSPTFRRPEYLPVLTVLLVSLVAVSSLLALFTQAIDSLMLGVGGLILAIWGVRPMPVPQPLAVVTAVDLAPSGVILLLLGLAVRAALHLHRRAGLRLPQLRRRA